MHSHLIPQSLSGRSVQWGALDICLYGVLPFPGTGSASRQKGQPAARRPEHGIDASIGSLLFLRLSEPDTA